MYTLKEIIDHVDGGHIRDIKQELVGSLEELLKTAPADAYESKGTYYYYLIRIFLLGSDVVETAIALSWYDHMNAAFRAAEAEYVGQTRGTASTARSLSKMQMKAFYKLMERYYSSLEVLYDKKDFFEAQKRSYIAKMQYRKRSYRNLGKHLPFLGYWFLEKTSMYGESFVRWGATSIVFMVFFAVVIGLIDQIQTGGMMIKGMDLYTYMYFSIVTFTTLGFGDVVPVTTLERIVVNFAAFLGYIMLGLFISLIQKKM